jgi:hypothetical protein
MRASRPVSQLRDDVEVSQRSSLLPWDNLGISSSTNGDIGPSNFPELGKDDTHKDDHVTVR